MYWTCRNINTIPREALEKVYEHLSPSRKEHIDRLRLEPDKCRSLAAQWLLQQLLEETCGITDSVLHRDSSGQPYLTGCDLFVSLSHCDDMVACAVSEEPVGIDIERIRPVKEGLCRRVCTPEELAYLQAAPEELSSDPASLRRFFEIWTGKEAYFKKCGTGITNLRSVNVLSLSRQVHTVEDYILQII